MKPITKFIGGWMAVYGKGRKTVILGRLGWWYWSHEMGN